MQLGFWAGSLTAALVAVSAAMTAAAQPPTSAVGEVLESDSPEGSVVVVRGSGVYSLAVGDTLFDGDRVFTRSNGRVKLRANGCEREMSTASSLEIGASFCEEPLASLAGAEVVEGVPVEVAEVAAAPEAPGATPGVIALLAAAGAGTAAATSGGGQNQSLSEATD